MPAASNHISLDQRQQESAQWLARLERGIRVDEGRQLKEWLADPMNRATILDAAGLWHSRDVQSLLFALTGTNPQQQSTVRKPSLLLPLLVALASTAGVVLMLLSGRTHHAENTLPAFAGTPYATAIGQTRQITLADGSRVTLNTDTLLTVSFLTQTREVVLIRGEATFDVAREARPFNVIAGRRTFQALGTRFNLRALPGASVDLIVAEGHVKVLDAPPSEPTTPARRRDTLTYGEVTVNAFEEALVDPGFQSVSPIDAQEVQARLAWQKGMIVLEDKALEDALAEIERYTPTKFVLADPKLGALRVSGRVPTGNVNAVRFTLRQHFLVASRRDTRGRIVLSPVPAS